MVSPAGGYRSCPTDQFMTQFDQFKNDHVLTDARNEEVNSARGIQKHVTETEWD